MIIIKNEEKEEITVKVPILICFNMWADNYVGLCN